MQQPTPSKLAAALRVWIDVGLVAVTLLVVALAVWLVVTSFRLGRPGTIGDGAVWVGIGTGQFIPVQRLELRQGAGQPPLGDPALVKARGELRFHTRRVDLMLLGFLPMFVVAGAVLAGGWQLRQVLVTVARGEAFAAANPPRIAAIGWIIVALTAIEPLLAYLPAAVVLRSVDVEGIDLSPTLMFDTGTLLTGLLIIVLAAVFREGVRLHEEQSLTV